MARTQTIYRDSTNGRFAKQSTYNRSVAQGGTRYTQQVVTHKVQEPDYAAPDDYSEDEWEEWAITIDY